MAKRVGKVFPWLVIFSWRRRRQEPLCGACGFKGRADGRLLACLAGGSFVRSLLHPPYQSRNRREQNWNGVSSSLLRLECVEMEGQKVGKDKERGRGREGFLSKNTGCRYAEQLSCAPWFRPAKGFRASSRRSSSNPFERKQEAQ